MSRIRPKSSLNEMAWHLGGEDIPVFTLCMDLGLVNPQTLRLLDKLEIYGQAIVRLYTDVCYRNLVTTNLVLQACHDQLFDDLTRDKLTHAIDNRGAGINTTAIVRRMIARAS